MTDTLTVSRELLRHTIDAMIGVFNGASITGMPVVKSVSALRADDEAMKRINAALADTEQFINKGN